eukprot:gb/GECG01005206.1/.p1 GENE.gb/GECG01005206.1/~~gb/GECG01005206.1/.p1  ORF type:complete len:412 (+),score=58.06 gb/GECG01005206.1/:1-1236(+)
MAAETPVPVPKLVAALQENKNYFIGSCSIKEGKKDDLNARIDACLKVGGERAIRRMKDVLETSIYVPSEEGDAREEAEANLESLRRLLIVACFLAQDVEAREVFRQGKLKRVFLGNGREVAKEKMKGWWEENPSTFELFKFSHLQSSLNALIENICVDEEEPTEDERMENKVSELYERVKNSMEREHNPWDHFTRTSPGRSVAFVHGVKDYYFGEFDIKTHTHSVAVPKCQLTGVAATECSAAHLCPLSQPAAMSDWGLSADDINDPRNGLYLSKRVEEHFDNSRLTFLWDFINDSFYSVVLDPDVRVNEPDLHQKQLNFPIPDHRPWKRILVNHSRIVFDYWKKKNHRLPEVDGQVMLGTHADGAEFWLLLPSQYPHWKFTYFESVGSSDVSNKNDSDDWLKQWFEAQKT